MTPQAQTKSVATRNEVIAFFDGRLRAAFESIPDAIAELPQSDLEKQRKPTEIDYFLRESLWKAVESAQKAGITTLYGSAIYGPVCSHQAFERVMVSPLRLAWLLLPPNEDKERMRVGLSLGMTNLLEFVAKPPTAETANAFLKAMEMLLNRVHGPLIQRIEAKHAHMNMNKPIAGPPTNVNDRLEELKKNLLPEKDVTPK